MESSGWYEVTEKIKCEYCHKDIPGDRYVDHLYNGHGIDVYRVMRNRARIRGLGWTFLVLTIGTIFGILLRSLV